MVRCHHVLYVWSATGPSYTPTSCKPTGIWPRRFNPLSRSTHCLSMSCMTLRITTVEPLEGHNLRLAFSDGLIRDVDLSPLLHGPLGEQLRDLAYFRRVRVDEQSRTIVWPNGLDPDPDMLRDNYLAAVPAPAQASDPA